MGSDYGVTKSATRLSDEHTHTHIYIYIYIHIYMCVYIYIRMYIYFPLEPSSPLPSHLSRSSQNTRVVSLCYTAAFH